MKKSVIFMLVLFAGAAVVFSSCSSAKNIAAKTVQNQAKDSFSREEMPFPFGDDVSARFTGTVYFKNMIQKDDVYNFPVTNTITFAPGARHWHGASADSTFAHLAANTNPEKTGVVWCSRLSAEEYKNLSKE